MSVFQANARLRIVMPVLNEGPTLAQYLHVLQALRQRGAELVVVDGGSTDSTWALASALADQVLLSPRGRAAQMNAGAKDCNADVLLFLHADTQLPQDADQLIARAIASGHSWGRFDVRIDGPDPMLRVVERLMNLRSRLTGIATGDQAMFVRRDLFERLGGFADLPLMEDIELSKRLKKLGRPACMNVPVVTSARRWQQHGVWHTIVLMWRLRLAFFLGTSPQALAQQYGYAPRPNPVTAAVAILAKAPVPGVAKTRLIPLLGAAGAARVQRRFTVNTLQVASQAALGPAALWCAPDTTHRFFRALRRVASTVCLDQPQGNIGARMLHAFARHFADHADLPLLLVGTDCPMLAPGHLQQAAQALNKHDVVLIPAEDGGYVLIGMRLLLPQVFEGIAWSTPQVMAQTCDQLRRAGVSWLELPTLWDVDEPADWRRLQGLLEPPDLKPIAARPMKAQT
jgi:rSAM/selenodomain-associated transferase 2/rSAM/selenodomain-associated transferase 1